MEAFTGAADLLAGAERRGIQLRVEGERLRFSAPHGAMTAELRAQLQAHKAELISLLLERGDPREALAKPRIYPPSFIQRRFWTLQKLNPSEAFYNVPFVFRLSGPVDPLVLRQSFNAMVRRHESLRTTLVELNGELMQVVNPRGEIQLIEAKLPGAQRDALSKALEAEMKRPFDLADESGLRVLLLELDKEEFVLQLCLHNTLFDQSSVIVLLKELSQQYAALLAGAEADLPKPVQYIEYVRWQESLALSGMEERLSYWKEWFSRGDPPKWSWPPAPAHPGFNSHITWLRLPPGLAQQIQSFSQRQGVTPFMTLIAAYAMLLRRYTNCADLTIGTTYSNRHWQFASLIGPTFDVPALRIDMTDNPGAVELLDLVREAITAALMHQDVPFERVQPSRASGPLFRVVCSYFAETPHGHLQLPGVEVEYLEEAINRLSRPDLYLVVYNDRSSEPAGLTGYWMHKQDVFTAETAQRMSRDFVALVSQLTLPA